MNMEEDKEMIAEEEKTEEEKLDVKKPCFHTFVKFKGYRKCIKCGVEIDK